MTTHLELSILRQEVDRLRYFNSEAPAQQKRLTQIERRIEQLELIERSLRAST